MNSNTMIECSRLSRFTAFLAKMGLKPRLRNRRPEKTKRIVNSIINRRDSGITGKDTKMSENENVGTELAEVEAIITAEEPVTEVVVTAPTATETPVVADKPAEPVYDGPMEITTRQAKAKDGKNGRGRGVRVCVAKTPADAEKIVARLKISTPATEIVVSSKYTAPTFVSADEFIASLDHEAALKTRIAEIIKSKNLTAEELALLQGK